MPEPHAPHLTPDTVQQTRLMPMYRVLLHNDDVNDMEHVVYSLHCVFGCPMQEAISIMLEAHTAGVALCRVEPLERAELHMEQLQSYGLSATIEPEEV